MNQWSESRENGNNLGNGHHTGACRVSVVVPALNEAENLPHVLPLIPEWVHEVILVDGASTDGTCEAAQHLLPDIRIVQQVGKGKGCALRSGFEAATGDIIVMLDADGSTDPGEIPAFVSVLLAGADFAKGSRFLHGAGTADMPFYRRLGNQVFVLAVRLLFGGRYTDLCYGYNAFWRSVVPALDLDADGFEIETMMNVRALKVGLKVVEVPSFEERRAYGAGRLRTIPDGWRVLQTIWAERHWRLTRRSTEHVQGSTVPYRVQPRTAYLSSLLSAARSNGDVPVTVKRQKWVDGVAVEDAGLSLEG